MCIFQDYASEFKHRIQAGVSKVSAKLCAVTIITPKLNCYSANKVNISKTKISAFKKCLIFSFLTVQEVD